jgi:hypothetical protein
LILGLPFSACAVGEPEGDVVAVSVSEARLAQSNCSSDGDLFEESEALDFIHVTSELSDDRYSDSGGGGIAVFDANEDGFTDVFVTQNVGCSMLFSGDGAGHFAPVPIDPDLAACDRSTNGAVPADVNGDGWQDLFVFGQRNESHGIRSRLFLGGPEGFSPGQVFDETRRTYAAVPGDVNDDGFIDVVFINFLTVDGGPPEDEIACNTLFLGHGDGTFTDASDGLPSPHCEGAGMTTALVYNYETDARDLFTVNDKGHFLTPNHYSLNGGDGTFVDRSEEVLFNDGVNGMGAAAGYLDGKLTFFVVVGGDGNVLTTQTEGLFVNVAAARGVQRNDGFAMGWGGLWLNDHLLIWDQGNFPGSPQVESIEETYQSAVVMKYPNEGTAAFTRVEDASSFFEPVNGHGSVRADFDGDGIPDLVKMQVAQRRPFGVFLGNRCTDDGALSVELFDEHGNPPIGIRVGLNGHAEVYGSASGLFGGSEPRAFFQGTGELIVSWSSNATTSVPVRPGYHYVITRR